ncbi:unnamed protein product, partial [Symbiodinium necroappetens]
CKCILGLHRHRLHAQPPGLVAAPARAAVLQDWADDPICEASILWAALGNRGGYRSRDRGQRCSVQYSSSEVAEEER